MTILARPGCLFLVPGLWVMVIVRDAERPSPELAGARSTPPKRGLGGEALVVVVGHCDLVASH